MTPTTVFLLALAVIVARMTWATLRRDRRVQLRLHRWRQARARRALERMAATEGRREP